MAMDRSRRTMRFGVYLVLVVLINLVSSTLFLRLDLTADKVYSLSSVSRATVSSLKEPLTINVFFTPDLPAPYNTVEQYLRDILAEYSLYANRHFNYRFYSVGADETRAGARDGDNRRLASDYGITPVQIQVMEKDEVKFKRAYMGLVIVHGDMVERIAALTSRDALEYKLTTAMQRLVNKIGALAGMKDKVEVRLYLSSSIMDVAPSMSIKDLPALPREVEKAASDLNNRLYGTISYGFVDPSERPQMEELSRRYNLMMLTWPDLDGGRIKAGSGVAGLVAEYRGRSFMIPVIQAVELPLFGTQYRLTPIETLKEALEQSIESLVGINETLGYLAGKGTLGLYAGPGSSASLNNFQEAASRIYSIREIGLDKGIPEGLGCLLIVRPTEPFTDYELYQIDQALMRGTNLAVFLDPFVETPQDPSQAPQPGRLVPVRTGIEKLLRHYGVDVRMSITCDRSCFKQPMPPQYGGGEQEIYYAPLIKSPQINHGPIFMRNIRELIAYKIAPLAIDQAGIKKNRLKSTVLFTTSEKSWELTNPTALNPMLVSPPADESSMAARPLACLVEGSFPSYFTGREIPAQPSGSTKDGHAADDQTPARLQHEGGFIPTSRPARLFVIGSSEMITDNLIAEQGDNPNAVFLLNVVDALNNREEIASMRAKVQSVSPLEAIDANVKMAAKVFNILGLPVLVALAGLFVWLARASRKRRIAAMFSAGGKA
jgi:ABC-type uncharacterized transport system involved in gliding motility auxiliary subunit